MRYRGDTARLMPKKSWKLFFPASDLFQAQEELNLNADYIDQTLLRSAVGYDLLSRIGVPTPRAGYARVFINGAYYGLYSQAEQIDERFFYRQGIDLHGNLYKPFYGNLELPKPWEDTPEYWRSQYPKKTNRQSGHADLVALVHLINDTPDAQFPEAIAEVFDVNEWIDWYAGNILLGNFEMLEKNYYLYHDFSAGTWMILPWDVDLALGHNAGWGGLEALFDTDISWDNPLDSGSQESKKIDGKWNALIDRMMGVPEFRYFYGRRLVEIMEDEFSPGEMFPTIDAAYAYIHKAAEADTHRWQPAGFTFDAGPAELKTYITNRRTWVFMHLPAFMPDLHPPLALNEMMADNVSTLADEAGDYDPWIELYNASATLTWDLGGMYLSDDPNVQPKWRIPDGTRIPPQGALLIWADGEPAEGPLHTNFVLNPAGGALDLWDRTVFGNAPIFNATYAAQAPDAAYGRLPDGSGAWQALPAPTPGWRNRGRPPVVTGTTRAPTWPAVGESATITTTVTDETPVTVTLWYRAFAPPAPPPAYTPLLMSQGSGVTQYVGMIPPQPAGAWVEYYVEAVDAAGMRAVDRPAWPHGDPLPPVTGGTHYRYVVGWSPPPLVINELMAINTHTVEDEHGKTPDWIEIHNAGTTAMDLSGMYLTDDPAFPNLYQIPSGTGIPAGGYALFWADDAGTGNHLNFKLAGAGEAAALFDRLDRGRGPIDVVYFDVQAPDVSWGRFPDAVGAWMAMDAPTPGASNLLQPPAFIQVTRAPRWPAANEPATVTAVVTSGNPIITATLWFEWSGQFWPVPMSPAEMGGGHNAQFAIRDARYTAVIPGFSADTRVAYYVEVTDLLGQSALSPSGAPTVTERYVAGYTPPPVVINEFLASNATINTDAWGEYDDWVELYNAGTIPVTLDGLHLSDNLANPTKWTFPVGAVIPAGGYLLVWCDGSPAQGPLHTGFKLDRDGEEIGLFDTAAHGLVPLDWLAFGFQETDISYGRRPDGAEVWAFLAPPTPGGANGE